MNSPLFSVAIPCHGRPDLLIETLNSLERQTMAHFEVVVSDDSDDPLDRAKIREIFEQFLTRKRESGSIVGKYIFTKPNLFQAANTIQALLACRGEFIRILHSDDVLAPSTLEAEAGIFQTNPNEVSFLFHSHSSFSKSFQPTENISWQLIEPTMLGRQMLPQGTAIPSAMAFRRRVLLDVFENVDYKFLCDWWWFWRAIYVSKHTKCFIVHVTKGLVGWRIHSTSITASQWRTYYFENVDFMQRITQSYEFKDILDFENDDVVFFMDVACASRVFRLLKDFIKLKLYLSPGAVCLVVAFFCREIPRCIMITERYLGRRILDRSLKLRILEFIRNQLRPVKSA